MRRLPGMYQRLHGRSTTWAVVLLPDLEKAKVYKIYDSGGRPDIFVPTYVCPSDATVSNSGAHLSYVVNGGRQGSALTQSIADGAFLNQVHNPDLVVHEQSFVDGRDYTLLYSENVDAMFYDTIGWNIWRVYDVEYHIPQAPGNDLHWGTAFFWSEDEPLLINSAGVPAGDECKSFAKDRAWVWKDCGGLGGKRMATWARPSSQHGGGVNVAFASGRALFLRDSIEPRVYISLMTLNDEATGTDADDFILEEKHYQ
jgi:hypothetical protein